MIQVVLSPRQFLNPLSSMQNNPNQQISQNGPTSTLHPSYLGTCSNFRDNNGDGVRNSNMMSAISSSVFTSSSSTPNSSQIQPHQLRELVREKLVAEGIRLSAPPYTIPTVRNVLMIDCIIFSSIVIVITLRYFIYPI